MSKTILSRCFRQLQGGQSPQLPALFFHANSRVFPVASFMCFQYESAQFCYNNQLCFLSEIWRVNMIGRDRPDCHCQINRITSRALHFCTTPFHIDLQFFGYLENVWFLRPFTLTKLLELYDENNICNITTNIGPREKKIIRTTFCCFAKKV